MHYCSRRKAPSMLVPYKDSTSSIPRPKPSPGYPKFAKPAYTVLSKTISDSYGWPHISRDSFATTLQRIHGPPTGTKTQLAHFPPTGSSVSIPTVKTDYLLAPKALACASSTTRITPSGQSQTTSPFPRESFAPSSPIVKATSG